MKLFDLHCDTITESCARQIPLLRNRELEISLYRGAPYDPWVQCFAIWVPDEIRGADAVAYFQKNVRHFQKELQRNPKWIRQCITPEDLDLAAREQQCGAILTVEGGAVLAGDAANIAMLRENGVRMLTLTWNGSCEIGDGAMVDAPRGLTEFGKTAIPLLEQAGIALDLSHASDPLFYDVAARTEKSFLATHSNARAVCNHPRNLTDEQFLEIRRRGGVAGLNLHRWFLREDGEASREDCFRHVYHFLSLGGENTVALGTDFDGGELPQDLHGIQDLTALAEYFSHMGLSDQVIAKIFHENAREFFNNL